MGSWLDILGLKPARWFGLIALTGAICLLLRACDVWPFTRWGYMIEVPLVLPTAVLLTVRLRTADRAQRQKDFHWRNDISLPACGCALFLLLILAGIAALIIGNTPAVHPAP